MIAFMHVLGPKIRVREHRVYELQCSELGSQVGDVLTAVQGLGLQL